MAVRSTPCALGLGSIPLSKDNCVDTDVCSGCPWVQVVQGIRVPIVPPQPVCSPAKMWGLHSTVQGGCVLASSPCEALQAPFPEQIPRPRDVPLVGFWGALCRGGARRVCWPLVTPCSLPSRGVESLSLDPHWPRVSHLVVS